MINKICLNKSQAKYLKLLVMPEIESCALLIGRIKNSTAIAENVCPVDNIASDSKTGYILHPQQMMNILSATRIINPKSKVELCAIFHTHPSGIPCPSKTDKLTAHQSGYKTVYLIQGESELRGYFWDGDQFYDVEIEYSDK